MGNSHRDCDVALFMASLDIPMRLDDLIEWVDPFNDRFELFLLDQLD
jgi:hypothetical protein